MHDIIQNQKGRLPFKMVVWGLAVVLALFALISLFITINKEDTPVEIKQSEITFVPPAGRNFENIEFADFRQEFDGQFNELADELSDCYYNYWKKGLSKPWQNYDKQATAEESKKLFDRLQALIWYWYDVEFDRQNKLQSLAKQIPEEQYNYVYDGEGEIKYKKSDFANKKISEFRDQGIEIEINYERK